MTQKKEQQLRILVAKKEQYFARIQRLFDNSRDVSTPEKANQFLIRYETLETTKTNFLDILDQINTLEYEINDKFVPNYQILETFDELICYIECVAKKVNVDIAGESQLRQNSSKSTRKLPE